MRQWEETPLWNRPVQWTASGLPFDLRAVRYVLAASELLSFSKVAYALDARVSTVSRSIRDLEDSLGVSLFQRSTMGVRLTDAGARFLDNVRLCCTNPVWDSSHESSVVAGIHEQTYTPDLQDQELASLQ